MEPEQRHARDVAAEQSGYVEQARAAFKAGWDAAMEYAAKKTAEGIEHLDDDGCCHFQD